MQTNLTGAAGATLEASAKHTINSVRVDNLTSQWMQILGQGTFVPPYTYGAVFDTPGVGSVVIQANAPSGAVQGAIIASEQYSVLLSSDPQSLQPGFSLNIRPPIYLPHDCRAFWFKPAAIGWKPILDNGHQATVDLAGGIKRATVKALDTNVESIYVCFQFTTLVTGGQDDPLPYGGAGLNTEIYELGAGEAQTWAWPFWALGSALNIANGFRSDARFGQVYVHNVTDGWQIAFVSG